MSLNKALRYPGRWNAPTTEYPMGVPKNRTSDTAKDGTYFEKDWLSEYEAFFGALMNEAGFSPSGDVDTAEASQFFDSLVNLNQVEPLNNDYNGYMDPDHQSSLPSGAGYPGGSGSPTTYALGAEISKGIYSGSAGNSVSSDDDGWVFSGSVYKEYTLTAKQIALIGVNSVNVFVKDEAGVSYFWKNGDTGVTVSKPTSTTLRVTLDAAIFGVITKLWRFFVTEKVGYVGELSEQGLIDVLQSELLRLRSIKSFSSPVRASDVQYTNTDPSPIFVSVSGQNLSAMRLNMRVDGVSVARSGGPGDGLNNTYATVQYEVPSGSTYLVSEVNILSIDASLLFLAILARSRYR